MKVLQNKRTLAFAVAFRLHVAHTNLLEFDYAYSGNN